MPTWIPSLKTFRPLVLLAALGVGLACVTGASAQEAGDPPARVGRLARLNGTVSFHTADQDQWSRAVLNYPVTSGNSLWTEPGARAGVQVADNAIDLDSATQLDIMRLDDGVFQASVPQGAIFATIRSMPARDRYEIATPRGMVTIARSGQYQIVAGDQGRPTQLVVFSGEASVANDSQTVTVSANETAILSGTGPIRAAVGPAGPRDAFAERMLALNGTPSAPPRPSVAGMPGAHELDEYGRWVATPAYGDVWYPNVAADWVPYRDGRWVWVDPWGWTWVDNAPWGFAPFHYGRWIEIDNRWGWTPVAVVGLARPAYPVYAPALVNFFGLNIDLGRGARIGIGLGGGSVGWVPLGPGEAYVPPYRVSRTYVRNVNVNYVRNVTNIKISNNYYYGRDGWRGDDRDQRRFTEFYNRRGATVVPAEAVVRSRPVRPAAERVDPARLAELRSSGAMAPVRPTGATPGVTPRVANRLGIAREPDKERDSHAPGPEIRASRDADRRGDGDRRREAPRRDEAPPSGAPARKEPDRAMPGRDRAGPPGWLGRGLSSAGFSGAGFWGAGQARPRPPAAPSRPPAAEPRQERGEPQRQQRERRDLMRQEQNRVQQREPQMRQQQMREQRQMQQREMPQRQVREPQRRPVPQQE